MSDNGERITALETHMDTLLKKVDNIEQDVQAIRSSLTQQRGFVAGMLTILTPLWGVVLFVAHKVYINLSNGTH